MVERRKPLILSSTRSLLDSVLNSTKQTKEEDVEGEKYQRYVNCRAGPALQLRAGILRFSKLQNDASDLKEVSLGDSSLVGLSASVLKRLSITSGSLAMAMEPLDEPVLHVNCSQTALVLGGSEPSAIPPDLLLGDSIEFEPVQGESVKILASVLAPALCPSALSSRFRVAVLLYGLAVTMPVSENSVFDFGEQPITGFYMKDGLSTYQHQVLLVALADSSEGLPTSIRRCFSHEINIGPLNEEQRVEMLSQSLQSVSEVPTDVALMDLVKDIVGQTSGFMPRDIHALIADAGANLISKLHTVERRDW